MTGTLAESQIMAKRPWSADELALLQDTDLSLREVAERTGRPAPTIAGKRQAAGIRSAKANREWGPAELGLLRDTAIPLREVAARTGRTLAACRRKADLLSVGKRQEKLGRAAEFTAAEDAVLVEMFGTVPHAVLAQYLDRSEAAIGKRAHRLGLRDGFPLGAEHWNWAGGVSQDPATGWRGHDWPEVRAAALERDGYVCQEPTCGMFDPAAKTLRVHHIIPWRLRQVNDLRWLITLCNSCHMQRPEHQWAEIPESVAALLSAEGGDV